jgi:hypothetical protein
MLPLVGIGLWQYHRHPVGKWTALLVVWVLIVPLLLYLPISLQRRFLDGYQAALAVLGAIGLAWLSQQFKAGKRRVFVLGSVFGVMLLTNLFLLHGALVTINRQASPVFHPDSQQAAFAWLAGNAAGQVVLAAYETGNVMPAYAPVRVFVGHGPETFESAEKQALLPRFFGEDDGFRQRLLQEYEINYLFYGPKERALGAFSPLESDYLKQVYDNGTVQIYEVIHTEKAALQ